ncbi:GATA transcription factor 7-like [Rutidosis leptorrhynchoides]|uniref:GATA transcription factor 7-like n=1 Tax=Rutidosis leptorrhynchoides TaxID=125765 RepID=UPI003A9A4E0E
MECIEARALKSSFYSQIIGMKSSQYQQQQEASIEDIWCCTGINVTADEFSIDDLLDLSDKNFSNSGEVSFEESSEEDFTSVSSPDFDNNSLNSTNFSSSGDLVSLTADQLSVPSDDVESLEWLSQLVDDSVSEIPFLSSTVNFKERTGEVGLNRFEPVTNTSARSFTVSGLTYPVPRKLRTERSRKRSRVWSSGSRSITESSTSSTSSRDSSITSQMLFKIPVHFTEFFVTQPAGKKQRKKPVLKTGEGSNESLSQRRCTHCQVQKTPQWRSGPLGPKTLCNACGVRFKSGRLYPEYRPAGSPTFSGDVHSNSHRKVLEMRKKMEIEVEPALNIAVQIGSS